MHQITDHVIMIRPRHFGYNAETAANNTFQSNDAGISAEQIAELAVKEFDAFVHLLEFHGVHVDVFEDTEAPVKPDAVFPNNWFSTHEDGTVITYPMLSAVRRAERREDVLTDIAKHYNVTKRYSFEVFEEQQQFLEGTGSLVLDRMHRIAYASISQRTDLGMLDRFCVLRGYSPCQFHALYKGVPVYHTNVVMALGDAWVVICMNCIPDVKERELLLESFQKSGKEIIEISEEQMAAFAGNMIQLQSRYGYSLCVMSDSAHNSLTEDQISTLEKYSRVVHGPVDTIEKFGGGSARCMIAENFLARRT